MMKSHLLLGIEKISKLLNVEFNYTVSNHNFELGLPLENALKNWFVPYFPKRYSFGSGYLVDINENVSSQSDWLIYDPIHFSPLIRKSHAEDGVEFYPFDSAYASIEVKRTLKEPSLSKAIEQLTKTRSLSRSGSDPTYIHPLLSFKEIARKDVSDIHANHFITALYAYSQDKSIPESAADLCSYVVDNFEFQDIPDLIVIHGKFIIFKVSCISEVGGGKKYKFSYKPSERNAIACKQSGELTSGYFYVLLLSMLQNTFLNASDYTNCLYSIISDFGEIHTRMGRGQNVNII